jgi:hypothetical protein
MGRAPRVGSLADTDGGIIAAGWGSKGVMAQKFVARGRSDANDATADFPFATVPHR